MEIKIYICRIIFSIWQINCQHILYNNVINKNDIHEKDMK